MNELAIIAFWVLTGVAVVQVIPGLIYAGVLRWRRYEPLADEDCPRAAVLLCLRGHDPFLKNCIEGLVSQDYPDYDVWIMLDHPDDPAQRAVQEVIQQRRPANLFVKTVTVHRDDCSLLNNSVVEAVQQMDSSYEVLALLDADVNPQRNWLRTLVAPLAKERIGVASGNRWYMPSVSNVAALIRYVWNAGAVVQMFFNRFTWGGSLAMKMKLVRETGLADRWSETLSHDTPIYNELRKSGLRYAFVPEMMMVNRESCQFGGFFRWVTRQMLIGRLYHPGWLPVLIHGLVTTLLIVIALILLIAFLANREWTSAAWLSGGLMGYAASMVLTLAAIELAVRHTVKCRGESTGWLGVGVLLKFVLAIPLTQFVYAGALLKAVFIRFVEWRGVHYRVKKAGQVELVEYLPFQSSSSPPDSLKSL